MANLLSKGNGERMAALPASGLPCRDGKIPIYGKAPEMVSTFLSSLVAAPGAFSTDGPEHARGFRPFALAFLICLFQFSQHLSWPYPACSEELQHALVPDTVEALRDIDQLLLRQLANFSDKNSRQAGRLLIFLAVSPGFRALTKSKQEALLRYLGGTAKGYSKKGRFVIAEMMEKERYPDQSPEKQAQLLRDFCWRGEYLPFNVPHIENFSSLRSSSMAYGGAGFELPSEPLTMAHTFRVKIAGKEIKIFLVAPGDSQTTLPGLEHPRAPAPDRMAPMKTSSVSNVVAALRSLPKDVLGQINSIGIRDKGANQVYPRLRDPSTVIATTNLASGHIDLWGHPRSSSVAFLRASLCHEAGHLWWNRIQDREVAARFLESCGGFFSSQYARTTILESIAEDYSFYYTAIGTSEEKARQQLRPELFAFFDSIADRD